MYNSADILIYVRHLPLLQTEPAARYFHFVVDSFLECTYIISTVFTGRTEKAIERVFFLNAVLSSSIHFHESTHKIAFHSFSRICAEVHSVYE